MRTLVSSTLLCLHLLVGADDVSNREERAGLDWWSLQPLRSVTVPITSEWARNSIDPFINRKWIEYRLRPSPQANQRTLIRRLYYNLIGLPPTPSELDAFLSDPSDKAYNRLVDRLLASPHYGERWGRHWLDAAHFGESNGFEYNQPRNHSWRYRNWVIDALNQDMPYDRFVRMQLAGDILESDAQGIIATGFLVTGPHNTTKPSNDTMQKTMRQDEMEDMIALVGQTFLGLTVNCARCHDHKFDPISLNDYYSLASSLAGVEFGERTIGSTDEKAWAVTPIPPGITHVLQRGSVKSQGELASPRGLPALRMLNSNFSLSPDAEDKERRVKLAEWITDANNPLFARVMVNRVWKHHFGQGIVSTPNDFGFNGGTPSHPDLLDWLAQYFKNSQWSLKQLHRLIVTSSTYRQASSFDPESARVDAGNRYLWRMQPTRLEGEILRDTLLHMAGLLDRQLGGVGYRDMREYQFKGSHFYDIIPQNQPNQYRRTIYRFSPRGAKRTLLDTFDCPDPSAITPNRAVTTTPLQSLGLMNNDFVVHMSDAFAERLKIQAGSDVGKQINLACRLAYGRKSTPEDQDLSIPFIKKHGLAAWCRVVFNSNEMLYVR